MTIDEYFLLIPDVNVRDRAYTNILNRHGFAKLDEEVDSFGEALQNAFGWAKTPEGAEFWKGLCVYAKDNDI